MKGETMKGVLENIKWIFDIIRSFFYNKSNNKQKAHNIDTINNNQGTIINGDNVTK